MCTYNTISSHTDHFELQKRDSDESLLTIVNMFPSYSIFIFILYLYSYLWPLPFGTIGGLYNIGSRR